MYSIMLNRADVGIFNISIGSTNALKDNYLQYYLTEVTASETESDTSSALYELGGNFTQSLDDPPQLDIDLGELMSSETHARPLRNIKSKHLSKIWNIDDYTSTRTINITSKHLVVLATQNYHEIIIPMIKL